MTRYSAACRLVYASAPVAPDGARIAALLAEGPDWLQVVDLAERERAGPALLHCLRPHEAGSIEAIAQLDRGARAHTFRMVRLAARLQRTIALFRERGIPVMLLKGAALGASRYGGFGLRPMSDADLLVRPHDAPRARQAVIDSGWPETTDPALLALLADEHHLPPFVDPEPSGLRIELHTRVLPKDAPFAFDESDLWRDAEPSPAPYAGALLPSRLHLVFHACVHFAWSHTMNFGAWRTFRDLSVLIAEPGFDWDELVRLAEATKSSTCCYWSLRLAVSLAGVAVPARVLDRLAPPNPAWSFDPLERHFVTALAPFEGPACPSQGLALWLWLAALRPRWSGHAASGPHDPENRWEQTMGTASTETGSAKLARHVRGAGHWWRFGTALLRSAAGGSPRD